jgi:Co/Zn/Cd efflux system component
MTEVETAIELAQGWSRRRRRQQAAYGIVFLMLLAAFVASLSLGVVSFSPWQALSALFPHFLPC